MHSLEVRVPPAGRPLNYPVLIGSGLTPDLARILGKVPFSRLALIADETVARHHMAVLVAALAALGVRPESFIIPPGEVAKTRATKAGLEDRLLASGFGRDSLFLALGGGVTLDVVGFTAATYMRGVPFVALPTTILAMVDSSVGGKTAVDTAEGKNLIGAFHPPLAVVADLHYLHTLPAAEIRAGFAEAIKHGLISSEEHLDQLERDAVRILNLEPEPLAEAIAASVVIKKRFVETDEEERGARKALNFGHTVGHAMERLSGFALRHGEAVACGLLAEAALSVHLGHLDKAVPGRICDLLRVYGLPVPEVGTVIPPVMRGVDADAFLAATRADKKARRGRVEYVLLAGLGRVARDPSRQAAWTWPVEDIVVRDVLFPGI